jgi:hypothetical protein
MKKILTKRILSNQYAIFSYEVKFSINKERKTKTKAEINAKTIKHE